jgi:hypothetical protein
LITSNYGTVTKTFDIDRSGGILTVRFNMQMGPAIVLGLIFLASFYLLFAFVFLLLLFNVVSPYRNYGVVLAVPAIIFYSVLYFMVSRGFVRRLTRREIIEVTPSAIILTERYFMGEKKRTFDLEHIPAIFFAGTEDFTRHPLDGNYADIGFRGMEALVQYQITDGTMIMQYGKRYIRFGRNIPSWDAEEIIAAIEQFTGRSLMVHTSDVDLDRAVEEYGVPPEDELLT